MVATAPTATANGRQFRQVSANFTRPSDTTAYASGDLVANSVTAASVTALSWTTTGSRPFVIPAIRLQKTGTSLSNASFRLHLYTEAPTVSTTGDNAAYASDVNSNAKWVDSYSGTMAAGHNDGCVMICPPDSLILRPVYFGDATTLYGLIEARAAYTPASAEVFTATLYLEFAQ